MIFEEDIDNAFAFGYLVVASFIALPACLVFTTNLTYLGSLLWSLPCGVFLAFFQRPSFIDSAISADSQNFRLSLGVLPSIVLAIFNPPSGIQVSILVIVIVIIYYENHNVNTPPFMAGMKRYPLKSC